MCTRALLAIKRILLVAQNSRSSFIVILSNNSQLWMVKLMNTQALNWRTPTLTLLTVAVSLGLTSCSDSDNSFDNEIINPSTEYAANIQRTEFGIPHITARDYKGLGYGVGYAFAEDNLCSLARELVVASGQSMLYLGDQGNVASDVFYT